MMFYGDEILSRYNNDRSVYDFVRRCDYNYPNTLLSGCGGLAGCMMGSNFGGCGCGNQCGCGCGCRCCTLFMPTILIPVTDQVFTTELPTFAGRARPGALVELSFADQTNRVVAGPNGTWEFIVTEPIAEGSHTLCVRQCHPHNLNRCSEQVCVPFSVDLVTP